jgi:hypothetical protein
MSRALMAYVPHIYTLRPPKSENDQFFNGEFRSPRAKLPIAA